MGVQPCSAMVSNISIVGCSNRQHLQYSLCVFIQWLVMRRFQLLGAISLAIKKLEVPRKSEQPVGGRQPANTDLG
jgi:hypothetical protein